MVWSPHGVARRKEDPAVYRLLERLIGPVFKWRKKTCILVVKRRV
ncbi:MAG: hypothetical protein ACM309_02890 [Bacillota bacterium]